MKTKFHKAPSKYKSVKATVNGFKFDSVAEADLYIELLLQEKAGLIKIIALQPKVYLTESRILYKPDFLILENTRHVYIGFKGVILPVFAIKKRLWETMGQEH